jgi:hypothetical protein
VQKLIDRKSEKKNSFFRWVKLEDFLAYLNAHQF